MALAGGAAAAAGVVESATAPAMMIGAQRAWSRFRTVMPVPFGGPANSVVESRGLCEPASRRGCLCRGSGPLDRVVRVPISYIGVLQPGGDTDKQVVGAAKTARLVFST